MRPTKYISLVKRNGVLFTRFFLAILGLLIFFLPSIPMRGQSADLAAKSQRGSELMQSGRFEVAVPIYQDLVRAVPNNPSLLMNLDSALYMTGQNRKAIPQFEAALKLDPDLLPANLFLGASRLRLGESAKTVAALEKGVQVQPEDPEARQMLAEALSAVERFGPTAEHYRKLTIDADFSV